MICKPKYQIWCESDFPCAQDRSIPVWFIWEVPGPVHRSIAINSDRLVANRRFFEKFEIRSSLRSDSIVIITGGRTDRHSSNVLEFHADQMSPRNLGFKINISRCYTRIDKTNIPSMRRV